MRLTSSPVSATRTSSAFMAAQTPPVRSCSLYTNMRLIGTVADHLHGQQSELNWPARIRIAVETAEALAYLHALELIIHRDVKTSNILLDHAFHAKVADLGICRLLPWDTEHVSTKPQGTMGYRDPEYDLYFRLTDKTDVYSFGVVLMEIISGQQAVDVNRDPEDIYLDRMTIRKITNDKLEELVDPRLGYHSNNDIRRMIHSIAQLAAECLQPTGNTRPSMVQVVTVLKEIQNEMEQLGLNDGTAQFGNITFGQSAGSGVGLGGWGFTFAELKIATRNFKWNTVIRELRSGGKSGLGMGIVVKKFNGVQIWECQSNFQFLKGLSHPNLVKLLGYCREDNEFLLVFEFMAEGTLEEHLCRRRALGLLSWDNRLKIAIGAARGLAFLLSSSNQFIYQDLKTSKILLDSNCNAKLSVSSYGTVPGTYDDLIYPSSCFGIDVYKAPEYNSTDSLRGGYPICYKISLSGASFTQRTRTY